MNLDIKNIIKANNIIVEDINQLLHNEGIEFNSRLDIIVEFINNKYYGKEITPDTISNSLAEDIVKKLDILVIDKNELFQKIFMFYCDKKTKVNLDQFYTPFTIGQFMCKLMIPNKKLIDPACGTGDLVINYDGDITLWDISPDVINICESNYNLNKKKYEIECINSINEYSKNNGKYDYCCLNPPFGSSTVIKNKEVLDKYTLGKGKVKEEIGIIFIERAINLLKEDGIIFIILPNGYLGNTAKNTKMLREYLLSYKIIAVLEFPGNTFSRSGTGVSTSLLILQKTKIYTSHNIFIKKINNIGYVLNKKNTPYKYKTISGKYVIENGKPILDNDLIECYTQLLSYVNNEHISLINRQLLMQDNTLKNYEVMSSGDLDSNILDINRYLDRYTVLLKNLKDNNAKTIGDYIKKTANGKFTIVNDMEYLYLDIKQITTPIYNKNNLIYGYDLPGRAKIKLKKYDIIVSKLKSNKNTFTIILDDVDNIICSNGFALLRPKDYDSAIIIFANLFSNSFHTQHNALCTGSIMESISDTDIKNIYINQNIDIAKYVKIIEALTTINKEL
jgi:hypothetical protein